MWVIDLMCIIDTARYLGPRYILGSMQAQLELIWVQNMGLLLPWILPLVP